MVPPLTLALWSFLQATVNMFYYQRQQTEPVPLGYHNLELSSRSLEPGEPYLLYILSKPRQEQPLQVFTFQEYVSQNKGYSPHCAAQAFSSLSTQCKCLFSVEGTNEKLAILSLLWWTPIL